MAFSGTLINAEQSRAGRIAVFVGAADTGATPYDTIPTSMYSVGACDGTVSISPNQDVVKLNRSDGQNPYAVLETAYDFQVSFSLQETDIYNLALACGYNTSIHDYSDASDMGGIYTNRMAQEIAIAAITISGTTMTVDITDADDFDGMGANHALIISAATDSEISKLNGHILRVNSYDSSTDTATIELTTPQDLLVADGTYNSNLGRARRLWPIDDLSTASDDELVIDLIESDSGTPAWEYSANTNYAPSQSGDISSRIQVGDYITIRNCLDATYSVLNGYPLRVTNAGTGNEARVSIAEFETLLSSTAATSYGGEDTIEASMVSGWVDGARYLQLGSDNQSDYRSLMFRVEGGGSSSHADEWHFFKCKLVYGGSVDYDRTGAVTYPVTAHVLGNSSDIVGKYISTSTFSRSNFYGDS